MDKSWRFWKSGIRPSPWIVGCPPSLALLVAARGYLLPAFVVARIRRSSASVAVIRTRRHSPAIVARGHSLPALVAAARRSPLPLVARRRRCCRASKDLKDRKWFCFWVARFVETCARTFWYVSSRSDSCFEPRCPALDPSLLDPCSTHVALDPHTIPVSIHARLLSLIHV